MPLLDHFQPPLSRTHPWRGFHGAWAAAMARLLNAGVLPQGYYAVPFVDGDGPFEIEVAALREFRPAEADDTSDDSRQWQPVPPELAVAVQWPSLEDVRVEVHTDDGDPQLAAAIELVSPRNKDRPRARAAFTAKCAEYLQRGCGLVVVDVVTTRRANLHVELLALLEVDSDSSNAGALSAVSYRSIGRNEQGQLLAWPTTLELGQRLPTVPLWLGGELAVPLDLEASHAAACLDLRIREAG